VSLDGIVQEFALLYRMAKIVLHLLCSQNLYNLLLIFRNKINSTIYTLFMK